MEQDTHTALASNTVLQQNTTSLAAQVTSANSLQSISIPGQLSSGETLPQVGLPCDPVVRRPPLDRLGPLDPVLTEAGGSLFFFHGLPATAVTCSLGECLWRWMEATVCSSQELW